jgi:hypothetical protein
MALKIVHNHNLLPDGFCHLAYPVQHVCAFAYNSQFNSLQWNRVTHALSVVSQNGTIILDDQIFCFDKYKINIIEYSDNILWIGYEYSFYILDMHTRSAHKYLSVFDARLIKPIGRDYWMYAIDENSSVPIFTWDLLTRLEPNMIPTVIVEPGTKVHPVTLADSAVNFFAIRNNTIQLLNREFKKINTANVLDFFPHYTKLTHPGVFNNGDEVVMQHLITVNDNCLLYYEWFDVIECRWGDIEGCESKYCYDFTTSRVVPFENEPLDYYVNGIFPFRDFDGHVKLCSYQYYPAGDWKQIYEPDYSKQEDTVLGKRKAEIQITSTL